MTRTLTEKQKQLLRYIARHIDTLGFQPSYREMSTHFGWSSAAAARNHLLAMERKGVVCLNCGEARAVQFRWKLWVRKKRRK